MKWAKVEGVVIGVLAVALVAQWNSGRQRVGLHYSEQAVVSRLPGLDDPATTYAVPLQVRVQKCVLGKVAIPVTGVMSWTSVDPVITTVEVSRGASVREPGPCREEVYLNDIPAPVIKRTEQVLAASGGTCVRWRIIGNETPTDSRIRPETWATQPFWLCREAPEVKR